MIKNNLLLVFILSFLVIISLPVWGDSTNDDNDQTNTSGSNTQITGGYTSTTKTHIHADDSYCVPCTLHCG